MFESAIVVTGRDARGRAVGRLLHRKPFWVADHTQVQADGRVLDEEGRDLGTTVIGDVAV